MFRNVLVGVEQREAGMDAIALARQLRAEDGELTLAHVYYHDAYAGPALPTRKELDEESRELLESLRDEAGIEAQVRSRPSLSPGRGLHELAELTGADVLVVGSIRDGLLGRIMVGEDTRSALNGAPCAVAVAPAGYSQRQTAIHEIGVGYNGSPESKHALQMAREFAAEHDAKLSALQVVDVPRFITHGRHAADGTAIKGFVDQAREDIAALGGVEPHAAYGDPAEELALYGDRVDMLVVGSRGYGPFGRLVHGSTTHELLRSGRCPLLVLTRGVHDGYEAEVPEGAAAVAG